MVQKMMPRRQKPVQDYQTEWNSAMQTIISLTNITNHIDYISIEINKGNYFYIKDYNALLLQFYKYLIPFLRPEEIVEMNEKFAQIELIMRRYDNAKAIMPNLIPYKLIKKFNLLEMDLRELRQYVGLGVPIEFIKTLDRTFKDVKL